MRALRSIVFLLGLILIMVGISQPLLPDYWFKISRSIAGSTYLLRIFGIVAVFFGVVLFLAAIRRAVTLGSFVAALGIISLVFGVIMLIRPVLIGNFLGTVFTNRPSEARLEVLWVAGLVRIAFGIILLFAVIKARPLPEQ